MREKSAQMKVSFLDTTIPSQAVRQSKINQFCRPMLLLAVLRMSSLLFFSGPRYSKHSSREQHLCCSMFLSYFLVLDRDSLPYSSMGTTHNCWTCVFTSRDRLVLVKMLIKLKSCLGVCSPSLGLTMHRQSAVINYPK